MVSTTTERARRYSRFAALLIAAALVIPMASTAAANDTATHGPVYPWLHEWQEFSVSVGDTVLLGARWGACTSGLARLAERAVSYDYSIDGVPLAIDFGWDPPVAVSWDLPGDATCVTGPHSDGEVWFLYAQHPIVFDTPGTYEIGAIVTANRTIIDGIDIDGDGRPEKYSGLLQDATSTVHVVAP